MITSDDAITEASAIGAGKSETLAATAAKIARWLDHAEDALQRDDKQLAIYCLRVARMLVRLD